MPYVYDPFCEKEYWADVNNNNYTAGYNINIIFITNPVCAVTGFLIVMMVLCTSNIENDDDGVLQQQVGSSGGGGKCISSSSSSSSNNNINKEEEGVPLLVADSSSSSSSSSSKSRESPLPDNNNNNNILLFALCRASLAIVGAGTVVFHSMDDQTAGIQAFNFRMCDRMPIVLMCTNIFMLYFTKLHVNLSGYTLSICFFFMYLYMCGLVLAVDTSTYEYLTLEWNKNNNDNNNDNNNNSGDGSSSRSSSSSTTTTQQQQNVYETFMNLILLSPVGMILVYATVSLYYCTEYIYYLISIWLMICGNLVIWALNAYLCRTWKWLFILHAVYHVTIAYTFLFATCVGMTFDGDWEIYLYKYCWPVVIKKKAVILKITGGDPCKIRLQCSSSSRSSD